MDASARRQMNRRKQRSSDPMTSRAPNILIVMADQLTPGFLRAYGHKLVKTPAIDALAREGVVFESAYCASPLCSPSRAAVHGRSAAFAHPRLRQRRRIRRRHPHLCASSARARLSHGAFRQDALLRPRPIARLRGAPDHRHLPRRFRLDAGLGPSGRTSELVSQHELGDAGGPRACAPTSSTSTTKSPSPPSARSTTRRAASTSARCCWSPRSPIPTTPIAITRRLLGPLSRRGDRHAGPRGPARRTRSAFAAPAPRLRDGRRAGDASARSAPPGAPITARSPMSTTISAG